MGSATLSSSATLFLSARSRANIFCTVHFARASASLLFRLGARGRVRRAGERVSQLRVLGHRSRQSAAKFRAWFRRNFCALQKGLLLQVSCLLVFAGLGGALLLYGVRSCVPSVGHFLLELHACSSCIGSCDCASGFFTAWSSVCGAFFGFFCVVCL